MELVTGAIAQGKTRVLAKMVAENSRFSASTVFSCELTESEMLNRIFQEKLKYNIEGLYPINIINFREKDDNELFKQIETTRTNYIFIDCYSSIIRKEFVDALNELEKKLCKSIVITKQLTRDKTIEGVSIVTYKKED